MAAPALVGFRGGGLVARRSELLFCPCLRRLQLLLSALQCAIGQASVTCTSRHINIQQQRDTFADLPDHAVLAAWFHQGNSVSSHRRHHTSMCYPSQASSACSTPAAGGGHPLVLRSRLPATPAAAQAPPCRHLGARQHLQLPAGAAPAPPCRLRGHCGFNMIIHLSVRDRHSCRGGASCRGVAGLPTGRAEAVFLSL